HSHNRISASSESRLSVYHRRHAGVFSAMRGHGALVALLLVFTFACVRYEVFLTPQNLLNVLRQNSMLGLVALGMTFVILTGGIDLSAGALVAVAGVTAGFLSRYGTGVSILGAIACTCLIGAGNGVFITRGRIPPFIAT